MADFVAVIRRAVDGLSDNTPEMRVKVYERARGAVQRQLENMKPRPPEEMLRRQLEKLEAAILEVEAEHAEALPVAGEQVAEAPLVEEEVHHPSPDEQHEQPAEEPVAEPQQSEPQPAVYAEPHEDVSPVEQAPHVAEEAEEEPAPVYHEAVEQVPEAPQPEVAAAPWVEPEVEHAQPAWEPEPAVVERPPQYLDELPAAAAAVEHFAQQQHAASPHTDVANQLDEIWAEVDAASNRAAPATARQPQQAAPDVAPPVIPAAAFTPAAFGHPASNEPAAPQPAAQPKMPAAEKSFAWDADVFEELQSAATAEPAKPRDKRLPDNAFDDVDLFADVHASPKAAPKGEASSDGWRELKELAGFDKLVEEGRGGGGSSIPPDLSQGMTSKLQGKSFRMEPKRRRFSIMGILLTLLGIAIVAGGGYFAWMNRQALNNMVTGLISSAPQTAVTDKPGAPPAQPTQTANSAPTKPATPSPAEPSAPATPPATGGATAPAAQDNAGAAQPPASANTDVASLDNDTNTVNTKFTERLLANGTEVDDGPGGVPGQPGAAEGKSVAEQNIAASAPAAPAATPPADAAPPAQPDAAQGQNGAANGAAPANQPADQQQTAQAGDVQKVFLYEERLGQSSPTAIVGAVNWSLQEGKGEDGRPEPSVQGLITVPERGLTATFTLSRNTDSSLPASHLVELAFQLPPNFEGGAIDSIQRISMKATEQDRGDPLIAVPAKVTDDVYMVALNDLPDSRATNLDLLKNRNWIDIPVVYRNGRRALLTMEKGPTGTDAFNKAIAEWGALGGVASTGQ